MMMNKKVIRLNPELDKVLNDIKMDLKLPKVRGTDQIAQIKLAEFAKIGKSIYPQINQLRNQSKGKTEHPLVRFFDAITP